MQNVPITGGRDVGPPKGWDPATQGECLTLSVLQTIDNGHPSITMAWHLDAAELDALAGGGAFFTSLALPFVPLQRLWVQDQAGAIVSDLSASVVGVTPVSPEKTMADRDRAVQVAGALRAAVIAVGKVLEERLGLQPPPHGWQSIDNAGIVERLSVLVGRVPEAKPGETRIPIKSLDDIVREAKGDQPAGGWPAEPVDPAVQADLEARLGVELNPRPGDGKGNG